MSKLTTVTYSFTIEATKSAQEEISKSFDGIEALIRNEVRGVGKIEYKKKDEE